MSVVLSQKRDKRRHKFPVQSTNICNISHIATM